MNPKDIAKLLTEDPDIIAETAWHISQLANVDSIIRHGLRKTERPLSNSGEGIYLSFSQRDAPYFASSSPIADIPGFVPVLVQVDVDMDDPHLVADEDQILHATDQKPTLTKYGRQLRELADFDNMEFADFGEASRWVLDKIDRYNIPPDYSWEARYGPTARYNGTISPDRIEKIFSLDENDNLTEIWTQNM